MEQRKNTTKIARHHGRKEETKPGSGGLLAASVDFSGDTSAKLRKLLDSTDPPFDVETSALSRKSRRNGGKLQVQRGLFERRLDVQYKVQPLNVWKKLRRYRKFTGKWWPCCYLR